MWILTIFFPVRQPSASQLVFFVDIKKLSMARIQNQVRPVFTETKEQRESRCLLSDCRNSLCEARLCTRINDTEAEIFITRTESRWSRTAVQSPGLFNADLSIIGFAYLGASGLVHTGLHCQHSAFAMYIVFYLKNLPCRVSFKKRGMMNTVYN